MSSGIHQDQIGKGLAFANDVFAHRRCRHIAISRHKRVHQGSMFSKRRPQTTGLVENVPAEIRQTPLGMDDFLVNHEIAAAVIDMFMQGPVGLLIAVALAQLSQRLG